MSDDYLVSRVLIGNLMGHNHREPSIIASHLVLLIRALDRHKRRITLDTLSKLTVILCEKCMLLVQSRANLIFIHVLSLVWR